MLEKLGQTRQRRVVFHREPSCDCFQGSRQLIRPHQAAPGFALVGGVDSIPTKKSYRRRAPRYNPNRAIRLRYCGFPVRVGRPANERALGGDANWFAAAGSRGTSRSSLQSDSVVPLVARADPALPGVCTGAAFPVVRSRRHFLKVTTNRLISR